MAPFDVVAGRYDEDFTETLLGRRQRAIVYRRLAGLVRPGTHVLELNCGPGEDAVWMAQRGAEVLATDASSEMLKVAERKAHRHGLDIGFRQLTIEQLADAQIADELGRFDLILSNFDGLNCVRDLSTLSENLRRLLKPNGHVVLVYMNPVCLMEMLAFAMRGKFARAFARLKPEGLSAHIGDGATVQTYFHSIGAMKKRLSQNFHIHRIEAVGLTTPPTLMRDFYGRHVGWFRRFERLEDLLSPVPPFNRIGDHVLIHAQLKG